MRLVADIGGTNCRIALSVDGKVKPETIQNFVNVEWPSFAAAARGFLQGHQAITVSDMVIAVAGPVRGDRAKVTNHEWTLDAPALAAEFGCTHIHLLNDLTALGYSVAGLRSDQIAQVTLLPVPNTAPKQALVAGIGTGFNVSPVIFTEAKVICPASEAGHVSLPHAIAKRLTEVGLPLDPFKTVEDLFSGRGFTRFCQLALSDHTLDGRDVVLRYQKARFRQAVDTYSALVGLLLRDLSLSYMALSGIYLAGSVARAVVGVSPTPCREAFQAPLPVKLDTDIPVWTIEDDGAALGGCGRFS